jgi:hypothetical protein
MLEIGRSCADFTFNSVVWQPLIFAEKIQAQSTQALIWCSTQLIDSEDFAFQNSVGDYFLDSHKQWGINCFNW